MHSFSFPYNENTVISREYPGPLDFDITGVDCIYIILLTCNTKFNYYILLKSEIIVGQHNTLYFGRRILFRKDDNRYPDKITYYSNMYIQI